MKAIRYMMSKIIASKWTQFLIILTLILILAFGVQKSFSAKDKLQYFSFDTLNRLYPRPAMDKIIIVDIDEKSLRELGQWPWPRDVLAKLVTSLADYRVKATVFDMVFAENDRTSPHLLAEELDVPEDALRNNDKVFAQAIKGAGNVVMGFTYAHKDDTRRPPKMNSSIRIKRADNSLFTKYSYPSRGVATNLPIFTNAARGNGAFIATPEDDGIIRNYNLFVTHNDKLYPSLAIEALRVAEGKGGALTIKPLEHPVLHGSHIIQIGNSDIEIPAAIDSKFKLKFRSFNREKEYISAYKIIDERYRDEVTPRLKGKVAFVGTSAEGLKDVRSTPINAFIPGVEVHANLYEQVLSSDYLARPLKLQRIEILFIAAVGFLVLFGSMIFGVFLTTILTTVSIGALVAGTKIAYINYGLLFDPLYPSLCVIIIFIVTTIINYMRTESQAKEVKEAFGMYLSPDVLSELTTDPDKLKLGGEMRELSVMFTDIRNFTTISENLTPEELINTMNDFLTPMSDVVMKSRGTIDKYMGDAMMAFWNAPLDDANHARHAVRAAIDMQNVLEPINRVLEAKAKKQGKPVLKLAAGIGVNTGLCSVGNMGSKQRFAYSALGDAVNLAARLEGQTKIYGVDLLIGQGTASQIRDFAVIEMDKIQVKGKTLPVRIYTVLGDDGVGSKTVFRKFRVEHKLFLRDYRRMDFASAIGRLESLMQDKYGQQLKNYYQMMMNRMDGFQENPPEAQWNGVYIAETK